MRISGDTAGHASLRVGREWRTVGVVVGVLNDEEHEQDKSRTKTAPQALTMTTEAGAAKLEDPAPCAHEGFWASSDC